MKNNVVKNDVLVISPSGKLYGSERVLLDFVKNTSLPFDIAVPGESDFFQTLEPLAKNFHIVTYEPTSLSAYYLRLFFLLGKGRYKKIYINEGAHIRYILLLARIFPSVIFTIHIRIVEDAAAERWKSIKGKIPANIKVVTISEYISRLMHFQNFIIPDPFIFSIDLPNFEKSRKDILNVGIVGRITLTKGAALLPDLLREIDERKLHDKYLIHLFGEMGHDIDPATELLLKSSKNIVLHGYVKNGKDIYDNLDMVMHLSDTEPLGRIFFEAVDYNLPFIGINAAGIGETAKNYQYTDLIVEPAEKKMMAAQLVDKLLLVSINYNKYLKIIDELKQKMRSNMSINKYCQHLEAIINNETVAVYS